MYVIHYGLEMFINIFAKQEVETKNNQKLMEEYEKFQNEQERTNRLQEGWQLEMRRYEEDTQQELMNTQSTAESHLNVKTTEINKVCTSYFLVRPIPLTNGINF
jgi:hypothetical protein